MKLTYLIAMMVILPCLASAEPTAENPYRQIELLNELNQARTRLEIQKTEHELHIELQDIRTTQMKLNERMDRRESDLGNYIDAISWISGIVIGFVGVIFGIGAFILYRENQDVTKKANRQLDLFNERAADQQKTFESWFEKAKQGYAKELEQLGRVMRLRALLDQENPSSEDIYPDLSPLYANPKLEYLPIFRKVMSLNLGADIKRATQAAIDHLSQMHHHDQP